MAAGFGPAGDGKSSSGILRALELVLPVNLTEPYLGLSPSPVNSETASDGGRRPQPPPAFGAHFGAVQQHMSTTSLSLSHASIIS